jgi:hypothetical protein
MPMKALSRRRFVQGAGVALALPWFETFAPAIACAQQAGGRRRYISLYFPNGTADFWHPTGAGAGDAWKLSPILEPLLPVKPYLNVLTNVANYATFGGHVEPSHSNCGAATWTCVRANGDGNANSGISVDQVIANKIGAATPLPSLQVGLSTLDSYTDGLPGQHSRSISWKSAGEPLYKIVNPQAVFDRLTSGMSSGGTSTADAMAATKRRALNKSLLDDVLQSARDLHDKLSRSDGVKLDQYLESVRSLEKRVGDPSMQMASSQCSPGARPSAVYSVGNVPPDYNRGTHASLMIDLVVMALECDLTRVVSFMLDDARSDFVYNFIKERKFTDGGSTEGMNSVGGYHGLQHAGDRNDGFATICWWNALQAATLAGKLAAIEEGEDGNLLQNTVITFGSGMHGGDHDPGDLPLVLIGGGGKSGSTTVLKQDQRFMFANEQRLADVHLTLLQHAFGCSDAAFGSSSGIIADLLS